LSPLDSFQASPEPSIAMAFYEFFTRVEAGQALTPDEMMAAIDLCMRGEVPDDDMGRFLLALRAKGESIEEIAGAARAMRRHMTRIHSPPAGTLDTCGTGGDASGTFNISTAAALAIAACGVPVAKHGNRSITSKSGSADVLAALGVRIDAPLAIVERCLAKVGICFCFAPHFHPAMQRVAAVRRRLGVPTIFNLLGPLCNPAGAPFQLLGVGRRDLHGTMAAALRLLAPQRAAVVSGSDGLDEVTLTGPTNVWLVTAESTTAVEWSPADFGLRPVATLESVRVDGPEASAALIQRVLSGESGPARDLVILNAAAGLWIAGFRESLAECAAAAASALDSGAARQRLDRFAALSHETP
jgi:anthranilate phosphoribosyltransferase